MKANSLALALGLGTLLATSMAAAEPGRLTPFVQASLGVRASRVSDAGFDPFADSDELVQFSLGLGATVVRFDRWSLAAVGFWDYGNKSSRARGEPSSLDVHRLSIGPELRYQLLTPLFVFAHALPAFAHSKATIDDSVIGGERAAAHWAYGVDAGAGAAVEVYSAPARQRFRPRLWAIAEGGYGYLGSTSLRLRPEPSSVAPERTAPLDLGSLSLSGPYLRVSAALCF